MKSSQLAALVAAALVVAACDVTPTEPVGTAAPRVSTAAAQGTGARHYVATYTQPLDGVPMVLYCEGTPSEVVTLSGTLEATFDFVDIPGGATRSRYFSRALNLAAVGTQSGDEYRASLSEHGITFLADGLMLTYTNRLRLRNVDEGYSFDLVISGMARLDENYEVIVEREDIRASCPLE